MKNAVNWFEIPVEDYNRAKSFYTQVLAVDVTDMHMPEMKYGTLPYAANGEGVGGALVEAPQMMKPSAEGTVVYLNGGEDLSVPLARVEQAGGKVMMPKTAVGEHGFIAHFMDTEGNRVALHSMN